MLYYMLMLILMFFDAKVRGLNKRQIRAFRVNHRPFEVASRNCQFQSSAVSLTQLKL